MMRKVLLLAVLLFAATPRGICGEFPAPLNERDFTAEELDESLLIANEVLSLSLDGKRLYQVLQTGTGSPNGATNRYVAGNGKGRTFVYSTTLRDPKRGYGVAIKEYRKAGPLGGGAGVGLIREKTAFFEDFGSVEFEAARDGDRKTVIRFTPFIGVPVQARKFSAGSLDLSGVLIKNRKEIVVRGIAANANKIEVSSRGLGTLTMSLEEFEGAKPLGTLRDSLMTFSLGEDRYEWLGKRPLANGGPWIVWIRHESGSRGDGVSVRGLP